MLSDQMVTDVRDVLAQHARIAVNPSSLALDDDLYEAGMTSHASVNVMLALEDRFDLEFPDAMLTREAFASIRAIVAAVGMLQTEAAA
jgi:acyl carrier protein